MKCPNCGTALEFEKKGSHWVPILILIVLSVLGICIFFATGGMPASARSDAYAGDDFFVRDGILYADPMTLMNIEKVTVPETLGGQTVTAIGNYGFAGVSYMTAIELPDTLESIREGAFTNCWSLQSIDLPSSVTTIGYNAFDGCNSLEAVHIPASVTFIGSNAFSECYNLSFIFYDGTMAEWEGLSLTELSSGTQVCCSDGTISQTE